MKALRGFFFDDGVAFSRVGLVCESNATLDVWEGGREQEPFFCMNKNGEKVCCVCVCVCALCLPACVASPPFSCLPVPGGIINKYRAASQSKKK